MKVAIVAESFLPNINGVTNSVLRVLEYLREQGHEAIVIAPGARDFEEEIGDYLGFPITRVPTIMVPLIDSLPIGVPRPVVTQAIREFAPDVVHLASPFVLGGAGAFAARMLQIPTVAVYQTDVAGFASRYRLSPLAAASWEWTKTLHNMCTRTLAPSSAAIADLHEHGIERVYHWGRGVDAALFHPDKRSERLRREKGPLGTLTQTINPAARIAQEGEQLLVSPANDSAEANAMSGTLRALVANMVTGVTKGFERRLTLVGVGFRAQAQGNALNLSLGFSHPIVHQLPEGVKAETPSQTEIVLKGADKQKVGQVAANIRAYRPPEPYKGKGVRYSDEKVTLKETKKK